MSTGVSGLDAALGGGLEPGSTTLLAGFSGTGKTILAQQICFTNATTDHHALYYTTLSEPHSKLIRHLETFDFFEKSKVGSEVRFLHLGDLIRHDVTGRLEPLFAEVLNTALDQQPALVVIDTIEVLRDYTEERQMRLALYDLTSQIAHTGTALLMLTERTPEREGRGPEYSLCDSIIHLAYEPHEPVDRRWVRVVKERGARHLMGKHSLRIGAGGIEVFPRIEALDIGEPAPVTGRILSGIPGLDELMGGGIGGGEATALLGPSGASKTIFGLQFVHQGLAQMERCLYISFQDSAEQLVTMAAGFGWDLETARTRAQLLIHHVPADELDLDVLAFHISTQLASGGFGRVVIDSLGEMVYAARESERFPAYARNLIGLIRNTGATLLITSETTALGPTAEQVGGVMFLFHNLILARYIELDSTTDRALNIVKMRNSDHSKHLHRLDIGDHGLRVGRALDDVSGLLGWSVLRAPVPDR